MTYMLLLNCALKLVEEIILNLPSLITGFQGLSPPPPPPFRNVYKKVLPSGEPLKNYLALLWLEVGQPWFRHSFRHLLSNCRVNKLLNCLIRLNNLQVVYYLRIFLIFN